ncbi:MAG TPA: hypothetical protein VH413_01535 [Verrucomicrobiae bacterium]|jgi:hypothetical protein|nr:hypothetical protein [Verrucomicrobiae bacterium]
MTNQLTMRAKFKTAVTAVASLYLGSTGLLLAQAPAIQAINGQTTPAPVLQYNQNTATRQQEEMLNNLTTTNAPELYPGEDEDVGPQHILKIKPIHNYFEGVADTQYAFTDNNRLDNHFHVSTLYAVNTVQIAFAPSAYDLGPGKFAPRVGFRSQWYNYGLGDNSQESALDFNAQTFFASGQYLWHENWEFDTELDYTRLLTQANYNQFYYEVMPAVTVQRFFKIRDNLIVSLIGQESYHFTGVPSIFGSSEDVNDRLDSVVGVSASWQILGKLVLQPYYRFDETYYRRDFAGVARNDFQHILGASATWYFTPQLSARVYASESIRTSDDQFTPSYDKLDTGLGLNLTLRF